MWDIYRFISLILSFFKQHHSFLHQGSVIFATERTEGYLDADSVWLQVPDGYIRERGILFGALGPPSVVPFAPEVHLPESQARLLVPATTFFLYSVGKN